MLSISFDRRGMKCTSSHSCLALIYLPHIAILLPCYLSDTCVRENNGDTIHGRVIKTDSLKNNAALINIFAGKSFSLSRVCDTVIALRDRHLVRRSGQERGERRGIGGAGGSKGWLISDNYSGL